MANVSVKNVTKRYGSVLAVRNMSLDVQDGEFVVFLGPSGCGKTTTLRSIAGLETPEEGDIIIDECRVNDLGPGERDIAFVFQFYALYPHLKVYSNISFPLRTQRMDKGQIDRNVQRVAKSLHIEHLLNRKIRQLSSGEQQRVALARAMVRNPKVFLMDEPLSNLDAKMRGNMRAELKRLQSDEGSTTIYVTHDQIEAMAMGDRIAVMHEGFLQQIGTPMEVYDHPATLFVAGFIGTPPMNLVPCVCTESGAGRSCTLTHGDVSVALLPEQAAKVDRELLGKDLVLGVRPEDLSVVAQATADAISAEVYVVEPLGDENILDVQLGGRTMKATVPPTILPRVGDTLTLAIDRPRMHLFDPESGKAFF